MSATKQNRGRKVLRTGFVLGLFGLLVASFAATTAGQTPTKEESDSPSGPPAQPDATRHLTFLLKRISDGKLCPTSNPDCDDSDIWWKQFTLLASDGQTVYLTSISFPSVDRSKKRLDLAAKGAEKILRRNSELNSKGEPFGERVFAVFPEQSDTKSSLRAAHYKLFWTWGVNYWEIDGETLEDVVALEERLNEQGVGAVWGWAPKVPYRRD